MPILKRFEAVEVAIPNGSTNTRFYFPNLPNLANAMIQNIQVYGNKFIDIVIGRYYRPLGIVLNELQKKKAQQNNH